MSNRIVFTLGLLSGVALAFVFQAHRLQAQVAPAQPATPDPAGDVKQAATFANSYRLHPMTDGVIFDFGLNAPKTDASTGSTEMQLSVTNRIMMNYYTVKKLQTTLTLVVKKYEEKFGPIQPPPGDNAATPAK